VIGQSVEGDDANELAVHEVGKDLIGAGTLLRLPKPTLQRFERAGTPLGVTYRMAWVTQAPFM
jgi:hypothetical protein